MRIAPGIHKAKAARNVAMVRRHVYPNTNVQKAGCLRDSMVAAMNQMMNLAMEMNQKEWTGVK